LSTYEHASGPVQLNTTARKSDGYLLCNVLCPRPDLQDDISFSESTGVSRAAVGIFFQPLFDGEVRFGAHPGPLIYHWYADAINCDVNSRGAVGLRAYRFKLDQTVDAPSSDHDYFLDKDWELWYKEGGGPHDGTFNPWLTTDYFHVSKDRYYNFWVYMRLNAHSDGAESVLWAGMAAAQMNGFVPRIKWKYLT
jgi:hypothetical protein